MRTKAVDYGLRIVVALLLVVSGAIHLALADDYPPFGKWLTQPQAFRVQAVTVLVLAVAVLLVPRRRWLVWVAVLLVAGASLVVLVLSVYWDHVSSLPGVVKDATWDSPGRHYLGLSQKRLAAVVEAAAAGLALVPLALSRRAD